MTSRKSTIRSMVAGIVLTIATVSLFAFTSSTSLASQYVYVKVTQGAGNWTKIIVVYPDGKTEMTELATGTPKNHEANAIKIATVMNSLGSQGYSLITSNGGEYHSQFVFGK